MLEGASIHREPDALICRSEDLRVADVLDVVVGVKVRVGVGEISVRCVGWTRSSGVAFAAVFGVVATINAIGAMAQGHWTAGAVMGVVGLVGVHWVLALSTASVDASGDALRVRSGLLRRRVVAGDVQEIRVGGPTGQSRVVLLVTKTTGRPRRIKTVQQMNTSKNRQALESASVELSRALGLSV